MAKMQRHFDEPQENYLEKKLLRAAHYLATQWEFGIIYHSIRAFTVLRKRKRL